MIATINRPRFLQMRDYGYPIKPKSVRVTLVGAVCRAFDVDAQALMSKTRAIDLVYPRHFYRYALKKFTNYTLDTIAELTGCTNHASVIHSVRTAENLMLTDADYRAKCDQVLKKILNNQILMPKKCQL